MFHYVKLLLVGLCVVIIGAVIGYIVSTNIGDVSLLSPLGLPLNQTRQNQIIGFLPYWLLSSAESDYSPYITTLTYFGLTIDTDGHILKKMNKTETEPGWHSLNSGKVDPFLQTAKTKKLVLSLLVFAGQEKTIYSLIDSPEQHAQNLVTDIVPIMQQYGFTDLNVDIESISTASESVRQQFATFISSVNRQLKTQGNYTLTVEVTASDAIKNKLIDVSKLSYVADHIVIMAYDYHYMGSQVTGPVAPLNGGGDAYEYDVSTAVDQALKYISPAQILLGIPSYGYEWETLSNATSSAVLPGSGLTATAKRVQTILDGCINCIQINDPITQEAFVSYPDNKTNTIHQINFPTQLSTQSKIDLAKEKKLGGLAIWALGYENNTILEPLKKYKP